MTQLLPDPLKLVLFFLVGDYTECLPSIRMQLSSLDLVSLEGALVTDTPACRWQCLAVQVAVDGGRGSFKSLVT